MKNRKKIIIAAAAVAVIGIFIISAAAIISNLPEKEVGSFEHTIINRVDFLIESTSFTFVKTEKEQSFTVPVSVSAKKTEADFYAVINNISVSGIDYESCFVAPGGIIADSPALPGAVLGKSKAMWEIQFTFKADDAYTESPKVNIEYMSGVKEAVAGEYVLNTALSILVLDKYELLTAIDEAESFIAQNKASGTDLSALESALGAAKSIKNLGANTSQNAINNACAKLQSALTL